MVNSVCHIVGAGEFFGEIKILDGDYVIAADGGYDHLKKMGISPNLLIGDMDSVGDIDEGVQKLSFPIRKDETDMYLAYRKGVELGYKKFILYAGTGGREDHTFANHCLLIRAKKEGNDLILMSDKRKIYSVYNEEIAICGTPGNTVSIFAFGADAIGVKIKGLSYEADDITLYADIPTGVSNSYTDSGRGYISVDNGALLVMEEI